MLVKQGSQWHFRRVVPARLRSTLGRRELWASLGTSDRRLAQSRACHLYGCVEEWLVAAEHVVDLTDEIAALEAACAAEEADIVAIHRRTAELQAQVEESTHLLREAGHVATANARLAALNSKLSALNIPSVLARQDGRLQESRRQADRVLKVVTAQPAAALAVPQDVPAKPVMSSLFPAYFQHRKDVVGSTNQVMGQDGGTLQKFIEVCGDRPVDAFGRADVSRFLDTLRKLPAIHGKSAADKTGTIADLIARAERTKCARLSEKTVKRHRSATAQFFQYCVDQGHVTVSDHRDMWDSHRFRAPTVAARDQRDTWTSAELATLFGSPVWTGSHPKFRSKPGDSVVRDARFWIPLLALFHGGRLEEFADLRLRDVISESGIPAFRILESEDENGSRRRLKTANSTRVLPLHPEILRIGFLAYAKSLPADGPLFPDLQPQGKDGKRGPRLTRWFTEYRRAIDVYRDGVGMHAFRHLANTRLRDAITDWQQERHVAYLLGHGQGGGEGRERYDKGPGLKAIAATLALLSYPELDVSHLYIEKASDQRR